MGFSREEIQQLLIEKITGTISPADELLLQKLLSENQEVQQQWLLLLEELKQSEAKGFSIEVDEEEQWKKIKPLLKKRNNSRIISLSKGFIAAAIFLSAVVGVFWLMKETTRNPVSSASNPFPSAKKRVMLLLGDNSQLELPDSGSKSFHMKDAVINTNAGMLFYTASSGTQNWTLVVPAGLNYQVKLADGTQVWLNAETKLHFPNNFRNNSREIEVEGEAYFKVAKNRTKPFIVHTPRTEIIVTGTEFNVNTYNADRIQAALVEGSVITKSTGKRQVTIKPGYEALYIKDGFYTQTFDEVEVLSWMKGVYYFHNTPLKELANVLARWYDVNVKFDKNELQRKTFSGELIKKQSLDLFLENLTLSSDVQCQLKNGVVYFK